MEGCPVHKVVKGTIKKPAPRLRIRNPWEGGVVRAAQGGVIGGLDTRWVETVGLVQENPIVEIR